MNQQQYIALMQTVADGWNTKNAKQAVECFTDDAIYIEPPDKQFFKGKKELYEYFGGDTGFDMKLTWHHLFFNEDEQIGSGEYTFEMNETIHHGVAVIEIKNEKISLWREYDTVGKLSYDNFLKTSGKTFVFTITDLRNSLKEKS